MIIEVFNLTHILYLVITMTVSVGALVAAKLLIKSYKGKNIFLGVCAWGTFLLHISIMWVDYLNTGYAEARDNILFPIYFCNLSMYLLLFVSCIRNKEGRVFKILSPYVAYAGVLGGLITVLYPDFYAGKSIFEFEVFKSMASHTMLTIGCAYIFVGDFSKIRVKNVGSYAVGLLLAGLIGVVVNIMFKLSGRPSPNAMYLLNPPISDVPFLSGYVIAVLMLLLIFGFAALWEQVFLKQREQRWYAKLSALVRLKLCYQNEEEEG